MVRIVCVFSGLFYPARHGLILLVFLMVILVASPLVVAVGTIVMGATALWVSARHNQRGILVASQMGFHAVCQAGVSNTTRELRLPHQLSARSRVMPILTAVGGVTAGVLSLMRTYVGAPGVVVGMVVRLSTLICRRSALHSASLMLGCRCLTCRWCWSVDTLPPRPTGTRKLLVLVALVPPRVWEKAYARKRARPCWVNHASTFLVVILVVIHAAMPRAARLARMVTMGTAV